MKYLKSFEKLRIDNGYWVDVTSVGINFENNMIPDNFTDKEIDEIRRIVCEINPKFVIYSGYEIYPSGWTVTKSDPNIHNDFLDYRIISFKRKCKTRPYESYVQVYKYKDEWFGILDQVYNDPRIYRCDQWEGLVKCLQHIMLNN